MKRNSLLKFCGSLVLIVMAVFIIQSFNTKDVKNAATSYYYISNSMSAGAFGDEANWSTSGGGGCAEGSDVPCELVVPAGKTLQQHIGGLSNAQVLDLAASIRDVN